MDNVFQKLNSIIDIKTDKKEAARLLRELCLDITKSDFEIIKNHIFHGLDFALKTGYNINNEYHELKEKKYMDILGLLQTCYSLRLKNITGFEKRIEQFDRFDYTKLNAALYEFQITSILRDSGFDVSFIDEGNNKSPDLLVSLNGKSFEIECKNKTTSKDISRYSKSIYESIQTARKQFSKNYPGIIMIEIDSRYYDTYLQEVKVQRAMNNQIIKSFRNSETISAVILSTKKIQDKFDYLKYSHEIIKFENSEANLKLPEWFWEAFCTKAYIS